MCLLPIYKLCYKYNIYIYINNRCKYIIYFTITKYEIKLIYFIPKNVSNLYLIHYLFFDDNKINEKIIVKH